NFVPTGTLGTGMPSTPAVSSLQSQHFAYTRTSTAGCQRFLPFLHSIRTTSIQPGCLMSATPPFTQCNLGSSHSSTALVKAPDTEGCQHSASAETSATGISAPPLSPQRGTRITHIIIYLVTITISLSMPLRASLHLRIQTSA
ncbi:Hypothetical predicted protein, partial [Scomber scombrus]